MRCEWIAVAALTACAPSRREYVFGDVRWSVAPETAVLRRELAADGGGDLRLVSTTPGDAWSLARLAGADGAVVWTKPVAARMLHVAADTDGHAYITGIADDGADLGSGPLAGGGAFIAKYDADGALAWARSVGAPASCGLRIATSASGSIYAAGRCTGALAFGDTSLDCAGAFVAAIADDGTPGWAVTAPGMTEDDIDLATADDGLALAVEGRFTTTTTTTMLALDGSERWTAMTSGVGRIAATRTGEVILVEGTEVQLFDATGTSRWRVDIGRDPTDAAVAVGERGTVVTAFDGTLQAFSLQGAALDVDNSFAYYGLSSLAPLPHGALAVLAGNGLGVLDPP